MRTRNFETAYSPSSHPVLVFFLILLLSYSLPPIDSNGTIVLRQIYGTSSEFRLYPIYPPIRASPFTYRHQLQSPLLSTSPAFHSNFAPHQEFVPLSSG